MSSIKPIGFSLDPSNPSPVHYTSPLKRKWSEAGISHVAGEVISTANRAAFAGKRPRTFESLSNLLEDYLNTYPEDLLPFAHQIENYLKLTDRNSFFLVKCRLLMKNIAQNKEWSPERQKAELGILYYYLVSEKRIGSELDLLQQRLEEIEEELHALKKQHHQLEHKKLQELFPSGRVAYLLRCFVRMIFTPNWDFNLGGCYAVKELIKTHLSLRLTEEICCQINRVVGRCIHDEDFRNLFRDPFEVHPSLRESILIDMKLSSEEEMNFIYVRWDLLTAVLSLSGQNAGDPNCYAVAPMINIVASYPEIIIKLLIDVLKTGSFSFEGLDIPAALLLKGTTKYELDFTVSLNEEASNGLIALDVASSAIKEVPSELNAGEDEELPLNAFINKRFGSHSDYAKQIYLSHKQNNLQQMLLAILQFIASNTCKQDDDFSSFRQDSNLEQLLRGILIFLEPLFDKASITFKGRDDFYDRLLFHFLLMDSKSWSLKSEQGWIKLETHSQGLLHKKEDLAAYKPFKYTRSLFFYDQNEFKPVDTLDHFLSCLQEVLKKSLSSEDAEFSQLHHLLGSQECKEEMAKMLEFRNKSEVSIGWECYLASNAFLLCQSGGESSALITQSPFSQHFLPPIKVAPNQDVTSFFTTLCQICLEKSEKNPELKEPYSYVLSETNDHAFNLTPGVFQKYWQNPDLIRQTITSPANALLESPLTCEEKEEILSYLVDEDKVPQLLEMAQDCLTLRSLVTFLETQNIKLDQSNANVIENVMVGITEEMMRNHLDQILSALGISIDAEAYGDIIHDLERKFFIEDTLRLSPWTMAQWMQKALLNLTDSAPIPRLFLEEKLCEFFNLPQTIELGSLNHVFQLSERLHYEKLIIKYNFATRAPSLYGRRLKKSEFFNEEECNQFLNHLSIYFNHTNLQG